MQNVPKIVQARLQRTTPDAAQAHPDADLLTAFAERSLTESERALVTEHLAHCGDCRDVVALALPATEAVAISSTRAARNAWLSWPVLRWGVVAAGIVLVTSVGVRQYKQRTQQNAALVSSVMTRHETPAPAAQIPSPSPQTALPQALVPETQQTERQRAMSSHDQPAVTAEQPAPSLKAIFPQPQPKRGATAAGGIGRGFGGSSGSGTGQASKSNQGESRRDSYAFALAPASKQATPAAATPKTPTAENPNAGAAQQVAIPRPSQMVEVQSETAQIATQNLAPGQLAQAQTELPLRNQSSTNLDVVKAKESAPSQDASGGAFAPTLPAPNVSLHNSPSLMLRASPRWTISSTGALQRSFDAGKTWEDVNVREDVNVSQAFLASRSQVESARNKNEDKKNQKQKAQPNPTLIFRAVAAIGREVWAGGSGAMLFHSVDSGTHFTRVLPSAVGAVLTGDVTSIQFSDASNGTVTTSNAEVWITADDGQTWHKQQ